MAIDPFTEVYGKIWDLLEAHEGFTSLIRLGNRIRLDGSRKEPRKERVLDADLPEVVLLPAAGEAEPFATSDSVRLAQQYELQATSGDIRIDTAFFPLKYELIKALCRAEENLGLAYVTNVRVLTVTDNLPDAEAERGLPGWVLRIVIAVDMWFDRSTLQL